MKSKAILVTGSHRSGSTWTGKVISKAREVGYIHEPFNPGKKSGYVIEGLDHWYEYIYPNSKCKYMNDIDNALNFNYPFLEDIKASKSLPEIINSGKEYAGYTYYKMFKKRPLLKDPFALFSAEWLCNNYNMDVIVLIRHPASFISSLKIKNWTFDFNEFLSQPKLINDLLYPYRSQITEFASKRKDIIDEGILLWNCIHFVIYLYKKKYRDWHFIRHEDLSLNPIDEFRNIYNTLGLNYTNKCQKYVKLTSSSNKTERSPQRSDVFRKSKENITIWKSRLDIDEIRRIKNDTKNIAKYFYSEKDW